MFSLFQTWESPLQLWLMSLKWTYSGPMFRFHYSVPVSKKKNNIFSARTFSFFDFLSMLPVLWFSITPFWPAVRHSGVLGRIHKCLETSRALSLCTSSLRSLPVEAYSTQTSAQKHRSKKKLVGPYITLRLKFTAPCYSLCLPGRKVFTHTFDLGVLFFMYIVSRAEKGVLWEK